jgi:hypothetical protein
MPSENIITGIVPNRYYREDLGELLEIMHHMQADLRDTEQSRVPALAPKPRDITPERTLQTCLLCGEIGSSRGDCPDVCETGVHEHYLENNWRFSRPF